tara:strand:- start:352 stop:477 length:126 start_codon:yes stop_codon:yes gene_type:complete
LRQIDLESQVGELDSVGRAGPNTGTDPAITERTPNKKITRQ